MDSSKEKQATADTNTKLHPADIHNQAAFERLYAMLMDEDRRPLAFVGAGLSVDVGYPDWRTLLDRLHKSAFADVPEDDRESGALARNRDGLWRAQYYKQRLGDRYGGVLNKALASTPNPGSHKLAEALIALGFSHYLTTNYDEVLVEALSSRLKSKPPIVDAQETKVMREFLANINSTEPHIVYLHGRLDKPESIILTESDYLRRYKGTARAERELFAVLATRSVVFAGFSLGDPDLMEILRVMRGEDDGDTLRHFALLPLENADEESVERAFYRHKYGVEPIFYLPANGHKQLGQILKQLSLPKITEAPRIGARADSPEAAAPANATAVEWPQFRGPTGQGTTTASALPLRWSEKRNIRWKTEIPGQGWSSPVISQGRIWMTTATEEGHSLRAVSVDLESGRILHDVEVFRVDTPGPKHNLNSHASPTPAVAGERLYVHFGANGTACLSTKDASILWTNRELVVDHENGAGGSFVIAGDHLLIPCDGRDQQFEAALDKRTGKVAWKTTRSAVFTKPPDMRKAYATPLVIEVDGKLQSITTAADRLYSYDPATGKELWHVRYTGFSNVARPVTAHGMLYACTGVRNSEILAIRLSGNEGDCTETHIAWKRAIAVPHQPSPVIVGNSLYTVTDGGIASCIDAMTGAEIWKERLGNEFSASPIADANGRIYFCDRKNATTVIQAGDRFQLLEKNKLDDGCMASPAVAGNALILRTKSALYRIEDKGESKER